MVLMLERSTTIPMVTTAKTVSLIVTLCSSSLKARLISSLPLSDSFNVPSRDQIRFNDLVQNAKMRLCLLFRNSGFPEFPDVLDSVKTIHQYLS